uniref:Putative ovule protein n=1 Tax=Solanum chacoense TaxID=4108 RepID=A0A0V0GKH7_SOLCH
MLMYHLLFRHNLMAVLMNHLILRHHFITMLMNHLIFRHYLIILSGGCWSSCGFWGRHQYPEAQGCRKF